MTRRLTMEELIQTLYGGWKHVVLNWRAPTPADCALTIETVGSDAGRDHDRARDPLAITEMIGLEGEAVGAEVEAASAEKAAGIETASGTAATAGIAILTVMASAGRAADPETMQVTARVELVRLAQLEVTRRRSAVQLSRCLLQVRLRCQSMQVPQAGCLSAASSPLLAAQLPAQALLTLDSCSGIANGSAIGSETEALPSQ